MSIFSFNARNPERDAETDRDRFRRLSDLVEALLREITAERDGLRIRHGQATDDAAFSVLALEDGGGTKIARRVDHLTEAMMRASARLANLDAQLSLLDHLRGQIPTFGTRGNNLLRKG